MYNARSMYTPIFICIYLYSYLYSKYMCMYTLHTRRTAIHTIDNNDECSPRPLRVVGSNVARSRPSFISVFLFLDFPLIVTRCSRPIRRTFFRKATLRRIWPRRSACLYKKVKTDHARVPYPVYVILLVISGRAAISEPVIVLIAVHALFEENRGAVPPIRPL